MSETSNSTQANESAKPKKEIPVWAIRKIKEGEFSVFVERNGVKHFLATVTTLQEAETAYRENA